MTESISNSLVSPINDTGKHKMTFVDISMSNLKINTSNDDRRHIRDRSMGECTAETSRCADSEDDSGNTHSPGVSSAQSTETESISACDASNAELLCPAHLVGRVIGERGLLVRKLQTQTRCAISVAPCGIVPSPRKITFTGTSEAVAEAYASISEIIAEDASRFSNQEDREIISKIVTCPSDAVGKLIGRNGSNVKKLQSQHNVNIMIQQSPSSCQPAEVAISGRAPDVIAVEQIVKGIARGNKIHFDGDGGRTIFCQIKQVQCFINRSTGALDRLQSATVTDIEVERCLPPSEICMFHISGAKQHVDRAIEIILICSAHGISALDSFCYRDQRFMPSHLVRCPDIIPYTNHRMVSTVAPGQFSDNMCPTGGYYGPPVISAGHCAPYEGKGLGIHPNLHGINFQYCQLSSQPHIFYGGQPYIPVFSHSNYGSHQFPTTQNWQHQNPHPCYPLQNSMQQGNFRHYFPIQPVMQNITGTPGNPTKMVHFATQNEVNCISSDVVEDKNSSPVVEKMENI